MKLSELKISHDVKNTNRVYDLKDLVYKYGWTLVGTGADAVVAEHPNKDYVLKIFTNASAYTHFVSLVKDWSHTTNPHFPKFSRYTKKIPNSDYYYVRMEKLTPIGDTTTFIKNHLDELVYLALKFISSGARYHSILYFKLDEVLEELGYGRILDSRNTADREKFFKERPGVSQDWGIACRMLINQFKKLDIGIIDLHFFNFMMRGDTIVILDPYYTEKPLDETI